LLTRLCIGLVAIALCIAATSNSLAQERLDHADSAPAAAVANSTGLVKLPALLAERYRTILSLVLARRGCVEFEYYRAGVNDESLSSVRSVTKSVLSVLVGIALDREYLRLEEKLSELLPEVLNPAIDPQVREITVRDLLTMTSGFSSAPFGAKAGVPPTSEMWQWALNRPMQYTPGAHFDYDDYGANLLSVVLTRAIRQNSRTFAEQSLFHPLGITNFNWLADGDGYLIAVLKSRLAEGQLRFLPCWSLAPKGNQTFTHPIPTPALPGSGSRGRPAGGTSQPYTAPPGDLTV